MFGKAEETDRNNSQQVACRRLRDTCKHEIGTKASMAAQFKVFRKDERVQEDSSRAAASELDLRVHLKGEGRVAGPVSTPIHQCDRAVPVKRANNVIVTRYQIQRADIDVSETINYRSAGPSGTQ
jgi:hypothetical protein